ncbi:DUF4834 family protein [Patiriisocius sp. Uisw_017]|uniref:DUF4834 family protein n=1 Tax=Patiriisocius sp. Uisw_017 TaxID=3230968 RepID=UPI0039ED1D33
MAFIKTILIILLVYYGLKFIFRLASPYLMKYIQTKAGQKFEQAFENNNKQPPAKAEGEITIEKVPKQKKSSNEVGEYIDFEELD